MRKKFTNFTKMFDKDTINYFTNGDCWYLALTFAQKYGYNLGLVADEEDGNDIFWLHVVVELEDNKYLDITGIKTEDILIKEWNDSTLVGKVFIKTCTVEHFVKYNLLDAVPEYEDDYNIDYIVDKLFLQINKV